MASDKLTRWLAKDATGADNRALSQEEIAHVPAEMQSAIDLSRVRLISRAHNPFALGKILVRGHDIYWPACPSDFTRENISKQSLLIHELAHVWQYATGRLTALSYLTDARNWQYRYTMREGAVLDDYPIEQQADLVQDWFLMRCGHPPANYRGERPSQMWFKSVVDFTSPPATPARMSSLALSASSQPMILTHLFFSRSL